MRRRRGNPDIRTELAERGLMLWRNPETRRNRAILALGFNPDDPFFLDPGLAEQTGVLKQKGRILFDRLSRPEFGPLPIGTTTERWWKQK